MVASINALAQARVQVQELLDRPATGLTVAEAWGLARHLHSACNQLTEAQRLVSNAQQRQLPKAS